MCILPFSSFSSLSAAIREVKDEKARMHIVHPSFFILHLTESAAVSELKDDKARMHIVNTSCCIRQLTEVLKSVSRRMTN